MTQSIVELQIAIRKNNVTKVKSLIAAGVDVNEYLEDRETVIIEAAYYGNLEIVKILVEAGADVNVRVEDYLNPLEYAEYSFAITKDFDKRMRYLDIIEIIENAGVTREYFD
jgi:ankyrin repeat protein